MTLRKLMRLRQLMHLHYMHQTRYFRSPSLSFLYLTSSSTSKYELKFMSPRLTFTFLHSVKRSSNRSSNGTSMDFQNFSKNFPKKFWEFLFFVCGGTVFRLSSDCLLVLQKIFGKFCFYLWGSRLLLQNPPVEKHVLDPLGVPGSFSCTPPIHHSRNHLH